METSAQSAQTLPRENAGPQMSPQQPEQTHQTQWPRWQNPEEDKLDRRNIIQNIFNLFASRPRNSDNAQFKAKLPDFVRRLEEALYRTAHTKAEYTDPATLEARLQNVARRMVSTTPRRPDSERATPTPPPQQNGYGGPGQAGGNFPPGAASGQFQTAGGLQGFSGPSGTIAPQDQLLASSSAGLQSSMPQAMGMQQSQARQYAQHMSMPGQQQNASAASRMGQAQDSQAMGLLGSTQIKAEGGNSQMPMSSNGTFSGMNGQSHPGFMQQQQQAAGTGPVMSNGAPVLLRSSRDWAPGQSPTVLNATTMPNMQTGNSRITINGAGMTPSHLGSNLPQANGPYGHSGQMGMQQHGPPPMRMGGGNMMMNSGMIPIGAHAPSGASPMVPVGGMPQNNRHMNPGMQGDYGGGGMGGMQGHGGMGSPSMGGNMGTGMPGIPGGMPGIPSTSGQVSHSYNPGAQDGGFMDLQAMRERAHKKEYVAKQQRWLLFLRHCAKCQAPEGQCTYGESCTTAKELWRHILTCADAHCQYPRCLTSRELLKHHQKCTATDCPVCTPVKQYVQKQRMAMQKQQQESLRQREAERQRYGESRMQNGMVGNMYGMRNGLRPEEQPAKRLKPSQVQAVMKGNHGTSLVEAMSADEIQSHLENLRLTCQQTPARPNSNSMYGNGGVWPPQQVEPAESLCRACNISRYTFEPPSIFCTSCQQRIKRNQVYYTTPSKKSEGVKGYWCHGCYSEHRGEVIELEGMRVRKAELEKKKNDEETEEGWVQCDVCELWVHQICGLFNKGRNKEDTPYVCPSCLLEGLQKGQRQAIAVRPQAMLEAKDLPKCDLSNYLSERLDNVLENDRRVRAERDGCALEHVPTATGLTVRVINNVVKKMDVKPRFYDAFRKDGYQGTFQFKQKVIMLFQKQDGVDVCLYCLYMQEYGDDCPAPNRKWVYLSYLDSVKYFRPEGVMSHRDGLALRSLVYHEILSAYLNYVKARGYTSMFIWACPPMAGDDYILYCHPTKQKTPRSDHLREWYLRMLRIAQEEGVVTHLSNLYDTFFPGGRDHRIERPSVTQVPYFEGDYWPGEAENHLTNLSEHSRQSGKKNSKPGRTAKGTKGKRYGSEPATTDSQLMDKLGENLQSMKADFIVVHLQEPCSFCRQYISDGTRYFHPCPPTKTTIKPERTFEGISLDVPGQSSKTTSAMTRFQLCEECYLAEASAQKEGSATRRGLPSGVLLHDLVASKTAPIPPTHDEGNPELGCEFFETRQQFLSLCQGNHYQFDSMRRAKHSSMMVLYHLHNPEAPAFATTCNKCQVEIEPGAGFRCTVCQDFDMCRNCKETYGHHHQLVAHARKIDETTTRMTDAERDERNRQMARTMALLVHASACGDPNCGSSNCLKVKQLFHHAVSCQLKVIGGCQLCRRMWMLLQVHAKQCQRSDCPVPRCKELREMRRRAVVRQEDQRRVAYKNMLRQQNAANQSSGSQASGGPPGKGEPKHEPQY